MTEKDKKMQLQNRIFLWPVFSLR